MMQDFAGSAVLWLLAQAELIACLMCSLAAKGQIGMLEHRVHEASMRCND